MTTPRRPRRRIMRDFVIKEVSCVDRPAQARALAVLMKRDDREEHDMQFQKVGGDTVASFRTFEEAMAAIREREGCTQFEAMEKAAGEFPRLVEQYNDEGSRIGKRAAEVAAARIAERATAPEPVRAFEKRVEELMTRAHGRGERMTRLSALERAAREFPDELEDYQEA